MTENRHIGDAIINAVSIEPKVRAGSKVELQSIDNYNDNIKYMIIDQLIIISET